MTNVPPPPLSGVRVVSLAVNVPGPVAVDRLRRHGATVTTVLPPLGDPLETYAHEWYDDLHDGQELLTLDLKSAEGMSRLRVLLETADLLVTSHRPSALARLGLAWDDLHARHPHLCQVAVVGHPGAEAEVAGHDLTYQAVAGLVPAPAMPPTLVADLVGAERAVAEAFALLRVREVTGEGTCSEVALSDAAEAMAAPVRAGLTVRGGLLGGGLPGYAVYATADGYIAFAALEPHFLARAAALLGVEEPSRVAFEDVFGQRTSDDWVAWAREHDVPLAAVR